MVKKHFDTWSKMPTTKMVYEDKKPNSIEDMPITDYEDYPILLSFREKIEEMVKSKPRKEGELWHDYYEELLGGMSNLFEGYMPDKPSMCVKTTGTVSGSKWIVHGEKFKDEIISDSIAIVLMGCSKKWGDKIFDKRLNAFSLVAPVPYLSGWALRSWGRLVDFVPPISVADQISDMGKKLYITLKEIEKGTKIHLVGGSGALLYMVCKYFSDPEFFLKESYAVTSSPLKKMLILLKLMLTKFEGKKRGSLIEIMPLKGVVIGSTDANVYAEFFEKEFGVEPINSYAATELGCAMFGRPDRKLDFFPNIKSVYQEFLDKDGYIKKISEVKRGHTYELIATPFHSMLVRYRIGDLFKVTNFYDGMPVFSFEGRTCMVLEVCGYYRVTEDCMAKTLVNAGFRASDRWAVTRTLKPREHLLVLFEKEWPVSERQAEKLIFGSLLSSSSEFQSYVKDFNISDPSDAIKVEFLEKGAFTRYAIKQAKKNMPLGQYKPPKIITPERQHVLDELRSKGT